MGSYNVLIAEIRCASCHSNYQGKIQFRYGNTDQIRYQIGDKIKWGGNQIGDPNEKKVKVYGILETEQCPICGNNECDSEFDIYIENGILKDVLGMERYDYTGDGNYMVME